MLDFENINLKQTFKSIVYLVSQHHKYFFKLLLSKSSKFGVGVSLGITAAINAPLFVCKLTKLIEKYSLK